MIRDLTEWNQERQYYGCQGRRLACFKYQKVKPDPGTLHLLIRNGEMIWQPVITEGNKQQRQSHF
jgi:hypothetical protein